MSQPAYWTGHWCSNLPRATIGPPRIYPGRRKPFVVTDGISAHHELPPRPGVKCRCSGTSRTLDTGRASKPAVWIPLDSLGKPQRGSWACSEETTALRKSKSELTTKFHQRLVS